MTSSEDLRLVLQADPVLAHLLPRLRGLLDRQVQLLGSPALSWLSICGGSVKHCPTVKDCRKLVCFGDRIAAKLALAGGAGEKGSRSYHWCTAHRAYHTTSRRHRALR